MIRPAAPADLPLIAALVRELAEYERLSDQVVATEADFSEALFGAAPKAHGLIIEQSEKPVGFAVYFYNFSTFLGRAGIYVEDIYVRPEFRRGGHGLAVFKYLARRAVEENCGRMEWAVLDWNEPALRFYGALGAVPMSEWTVQRLSGDNLRAFAES
jgi:GNAT superfamily N-acetyltransferase